MMNELKLEEKPEVICKCSGTTRSHILALIANGTHNLERISRITGACSGCGACDTDIMQLLNANHSLQQNNY